jgi:hypothetical protein
MVLIATGADCAFARWIRDASDFLSTLSRQHPKMSAIQSGLRKLWDMRNSLEYNTVQIVRIKNVKLCIMHICLQLGILAYIIGYAIVAKRGYQGIEVVSGSAVLKVKGSAYNNGGLPWLLASNGAAPQTVAHAVIPPAFDQVYDAADLIQPPTERDAVFLTTNLWVTDNQTRSYCYPGSDAWFNAVFDTATADSDCAGLCVRGHVSVSGDGRKAIQIASA